MAGKRLTVARAAIGEVYVDDLIPAPLNDGEARLAVDGFAITSNNVTYAAIGEAFGYWDFFPVPEFAGPDSDRAGRGVVPVWGHATVVETRVPGLTVGERVYGYLPMASALVVVAQSVTRGSFVDAAPHRAARAAVYNQYRRLNADPAHDPAGESVRAVFEPLFLTSFLIEAMFRRAAWHGARRLIVTSASSKTALALAHVTRAASPDIERIALTSARNIGFVERTGLYDRVLGYDELTELHDPAGDRPAGDRPAGDRPAVAVDFAGNGATLAALHRAVGEGLRWSCLVGVTDWQHRGGFSGHDLPGPKPVLFFAPDHVATMIAELGGQGFQAAVAERWRAFAADAAALVRIETVDGLAAAATAWQAAVAGSVAPDAAVVVRV